MSAGSHSWIRTRRKRREMTLLSGKIREAAALALIVILATIGVGCNNSDSGHSAGFDARIEYVSWPQKYYGDNSTTGYVNFRVDVWRGSDGTQHPMLWVDVSRRDDFQDVPPAAFDETWYPVEFTEQMYLSRPMQMNGGYTVPGYYHMRIGLCADTSDLYDWEDKADGLEYRIFVGTNKFKLDFDIEQISQSGCDFIHLDWHEERIEAPYQNFPIGFFWSHSSSIPSNEGIKNTPEALQDYVNTYASHWPTPPQGSTGQAMQKHTSVLIAISHLLDPSSMSILWGILGRSFNDFEASFVCYEGIQYYFEEAQEQALWYTTSHELGHIVGRHLTDLCYDSWDHASNDDSPCLMTWLTRNSREWGNPPQHVFIPSQDCAATQYYHELDAFYGFCTTCATKLSSPDFLMEDYSWQKFNPVVYQNGDEKVSL
ncbi:MAG: hypothetical protein IT585_14140 [candidate division Zixibacteria bacterium]|nr:hypothetical protein [candidate division Zixibacteria bacterium]